MKLLVLFATLVASTLSWHIDRPNVRPIQEKFLKNPEKYPVHAAAANVTGRSGRIVGGEEVLPERGEWIPYQAALFVYTSNGQYFCGGAIIYTDWVITAASCVDDAPGGIEVLLGAHNILIVEPRQQSFFISENDVVLHYDWNPQTAHNDVALLHIEEEIDWDYGRYSYPLPSRNQENDIFVGEFGQISGWGATSDQNPQINAVLMKMYTPVISNDECREFYGGLITNEHMCTSGAGGRGACNGDNGGPLVVTARIMGIISFGSNQGCSSGAPTVHTALHKYLDFIGSTVGHEIIY